MYQNITQVAPSNGLNLLSTIKTLSTSFHLTSAAYHQLQSKQECSESKLLLEASGLLHGLMEQFEDLLEVEVDESLAENEIAITVYQHAREISE